MALSFVEIDGEPAGLLPAHTVRSLISGGHGDSGGRGSGGGSR